MRIVVMSDSHGRADRVKQVIEQQPQAELFIFLGDGLRDFRQAMRGVPKEGWCVCGNCDFVSDVEYNLISYVRDVKFFCTHGHQWGVKAGLDELATAGAIMSGIYVGDRCSPVSSSAALVCALTNTNIYANMRRMWTTSISMTGTHSTTGNR